MKANIKLTLGRLTPVRLNALLGNVIAKMTDNPHFPDPLVPLAHMRAKRTELRDAIAEATDGSRFARSKRDALVEEVKPLLDVQANYVRGIANGDRTILTSSGYELQRERQRMGILGPPQQIRACPRGDGGIHLRWSRVRGAIVYVVQRNSGVTDDGEDTWETVSITGKASFTYKGQERLKASYFRLSTIGAAGQGMFGQPVMAYAV
ncbi:MAG: hypothetical protein ABI599_09140 [Flavobacteriales bacterium]